MAAATLGAVAGDRPPPSAARRGRGRRAAPSPRGRGRQGGERPGTIGQREAEVSDLRSVVLAGGGTGGHIYPLLAFADAVKRHFPEVRITALGSPKGMENELIPP